MKLIPVVVILVSMFSVGCSENNANGTILIPEMSVEPPIDKYPSNDELSAVNGVPDLEQAKALIYGTWKAVIPDTQCVWTYQADLNGVFSENALDFLGSGYYTLQQSRFGIEVDLHYESDNFLSDCFGVIADKDYLSVEGPHSTFLIRFPDQNTLEFASGAGLPAYLTYTRQ